MVAERVQKVLARVGVGSRREIENWIRQGRVSINGSAAVLGSTVDDSDSIRIDQQLVRIRRAQRAVLRVVLYHKPVGEICSRNDPGGRPTVFENLPRLRSARWVSVGRLDVNSQGLLLFTTDGDLADRLMHPSSRIEREYRCRIQGEPDRDAIRQLSEGIRLDGQVSRFERIRHQGGRGANRWYEVVVREGRYREIRRMWSAVGCRVNRLIRTRYGDLVLPRSLKAGQLRELNRAEVKALLRSVDVSHSGRRSSASSA